MHDFKRSTGNPSSIRKAEARGWRHLVSLTYKETKLCLKKKKDHFWGFVEVLETETVQCWLTISMLNYLPSSLGVLLLFVFEV